MSRYLIRTRSGERGPFTEDQIVHLAMQRKIPLHLNVIDAESGTRVSVEQVLRRRAEFEELDAEEAPLAKPLGSPRFRRHGSGSAGKLQRSIGKRGRSSRSGGPLGERRSAGRAVGARRPRARRKSPFLVLGAAGAAVAVLAMVLYLAWPMLFGGVEGTWVVDTEMAFDIISKGIPGLNQAGAKGDFVRNTTKTLMAESLKDFGLIIDKNSARFHGSFMGAPMDEVPTSFKRRDLGRNQYEFTGTIPPGKQVTFMATLRQNRLWMKDTDGTKQEVPLKRG